MQQHGSKYFARRIGRVQLFQDMVMLHNKLREIEHHASTYSLLLHTLNLWDGLKGKKKSECGHVAYQIKEKEVWTNI